ncbi:Cell division protein FtsB [Oligella ureolytica]|uniref:septum formation initiator family protein n=1 Tax=Oligella ureolytica TaxID=90244 RepID=UPI000DFD34EA|nr:septum formation initiator family protein [Oligella ureolytica]SUA51083.1 Cell division protein FtsB [Oligella ureolytica]
MRLLLLVLLLACIAIQIPLRWGGSGYAQVDVLAQQLEQQLQRNKALEARNNAMQAEIDDLRDGTEALEERARVLLNLLADDEYLIQIISDKEQGE